MNVGALLLLIVGGVLSGLAALKVFVVFKRPNAGPELMADATFFILGAIVCFWLSRKMSKNRAAKF